MKENDPSTYILKGEIDIDDNVHFNTMVDAANCFGNNIKPKGIWTASAKHPYETDKIIWFPKIYEHEKFLNTISLDEEIIIEKARDLDIREKHIDKVFNKEVHKRIVFAKVKSPLGKQSYKYKGEYELDIEKSNLEKGLVWKRYKKKSKTYKPKYT